MSRNAFLAALVLAFATPIFAALPLAPKPVVLGPMAHSDVAPRTATNGRSTLVAWTSYRSAYAATNQVAMRLLGRESTARIINAGSPAAVATNGADYAIAFNVAGSRFQSHPYENTFVRLVREGGRLEEPVAINRSVSGGASGVVWSGTHWVVSYGSDGQSFVQVLDPALIHVATIPLGAGDSVGLVQSANDVWAFRREVTGVIEAIEIRPTDTGARFTSPFSMSHVAAVAVTPTGALLFGRAGTPDLQVTTFDQGRGFGSRVLATNASVTHAVPWNRGVATIVQDGPMIWRLLFDANGNITDTLELRNDASRFDRYDIGRTHEGLALFRATNAYSLGEEDADLYIHQNLTGPEQLVSIGDHGIQHSPFLASAGTHALAVWQQTLHDGSEGTFSRRIDANGAPIDDPIRLPIDLGYVQHGSMTFDGTHFVLVYASFPYVQATTISADGRTATPIVQLGEGNSPAVAATPNGRFAVWVDPTYQVRGTPLQVDGSAVIANGFPILPEGSPGQFETSIAAVRNGYLVLWNNGNVKATVISNAGTVQSHTDLGVTHQGPLFLASGSNSALAAAPSYLYTFRGNGEPVAKHEPQLASDWRIAGIAPIGHDRYLVALGIGNAIFTSEVTMDGGSVTSFTMPQYFAPRADLFTQVNGLPVAAYTQDRGVFVTGRAETARRRAARH